MSREEEKLKAADEYIRKRMKEGCGRTGDTFPAFIEGIEWADEHPSQDQINALRMEYEKGRADAIGMACEFLQDRIAHDSISYPMATHHLIEELKNYIKEQQ